MDSIKERIRRLVPIGCARTGGTRDVCLGPDQYPSICLALGVAVRLCRKGHCMRFRTILANLALLLMTMGATGALHFAHILGPECG